MTLRTFSYQNNLSQLQLYLRSNKSLDTPTENTTGLGILTTMFRYTDMYLDRLRLAK